MATLSLLPSKDEEIEHLDRTGILKHGAQMPTFHAYAPIDKLELPLEGDDEPIALGRHQTFHLRDTWLPKALDAVRKDGLALSRVEAHHQLGIGKNMLAAVRFWALSTGLLVPAREKRDGRQIPLALTPVSQLVTSHDPYFEDPATLWVLHSLLGSRRGGAAAWYWYFNESDLAAASEDELARSFGVWLSRVQPNYRAAPMALRREISCLVRTYVSKAMDGGRNIAEDELVSPFTDLSLLSDDGGTVRLMIGPKANLPLEPFLFALQCFIQASGRTTASLDDLRWLPRSPGRLLGLDAPSLLSYLEQAEREGHLRLTMTAGLRNVSVAIEPALAPLERYYEHAAT